MKIINDSNEGFKIFFLENIIDLAPKSEVYVSDKYRREITADIRDLKNPLVYIDKRPNIIKRFINNKKYNKR